MEEAVTVYGNEVYLYKIRENYLSMEGSETDSFLGEYNVSYFNASMSFSPVKIATADDFSAVPEMKWAIESGSIFYVVSSSVIPSMSRADFSLAKSFGIQNQYTNFLPQYTYIKGGIIYFTVKDPTPFISPLDSPYVVVQYVDSNYIINNQPTNPTNQVVQYIAYKSDCKGNALFPCSSNISTNS
jgi:hypothetical protein